MGKFTRYFNNDFAACRLLAYAHDHCRDREVRIYQVPGELECVGVTDGTDKWIAPVSDTIFSVPIRKMMRDIHDGIHVPAPVRAAQPGRRSRVQLGRELVVIGSGTARPRVRIRIDEPAKPEELVSQFSEGFKDVKKWQEKTIINSAPRKTRVRI